MAGSLVDLSGLTEPATKLIEKVSDAIGGLAKPWQLERVARAEARGEIIRAEARIEISDIERRGLERMVREEGKKQENIESITRQAAEGLGGDAKPESVSDDWITHFFDRARLISDGEAQQLWAAILAKEATEPGTFSRKTIEILASIDKADAKDFESLLQFSFEFGELRVSIPDVSNNIFTSKGITFEKLIHLQSLGLISFNPLSGYALQNLSGLAVAKYFDQTIHLKFSGNNLDLGNVMLTSSGKQLSKAANRKPNTEYITYLKGLWKRQGLISGTTIPSNIGF